MHYFTQITKQMFSFTTNHADNEGLHRFLGNAFLTFLCPLQYNGGEYNVVCATPSIEKKTLRLRWYNRQSSKVHVEMSRCIFEVVTGEREAREQVGREE